MGQLGAIIYGVAIGCIALLFARESLEPAIYLYQQSTGGRTALCVVGWLVATIGPVALSGCTWVLVRKIDARWLTHLVFIPTAIVIFRFGSSVFFDATGTNEDMTLGGYSMLAACALLPFTMFVHATACVVEGYRFVTHLVRGS